MKKGLLILAVAAMTLAPTSASAARRIFVARPYVGGWYGGWGGPYTGFWGPYWGPYWGYGYYPNSGDIKIDTKVRDAQVFINGAYAGTTKENHTMHLRPGAYNIEIKLGGQTLYAERIYVARGKTLHIRPEL